MYSKVSLNTAELTKVLSRKVLKGSETDTWRKDNDKSTLWHVQVPVQDPEFALQCFFHLSNGPEYLFHHCFLKMILKYSGLWQ